MRLSRESVVVDLLMPGREVVRSAWGKPPALRMGEPGELARLGGTPKTGSSGTLSRISAASASSDVFRMAEFRVGE